MPIFIIHDPIVRRLSIYIMPVWSTYCPETGREHAVLVSERFCPSCSAHNPHLIVQSANTSFDSIPFQGLTSSIEPIIIEDGPAEASKPSRFTTHGHRMAVSARQEGFQSGKSTIRPTSELGLVRKASGALPKTLVGDRFHTTLIVVRGFYQMVSTSESDEEEKQYVRWLKPRK